MPIVEQQPKRYTTSNSNTVKNFKLPGKEWKPLCRVEVSRFTKKAKEDTGIPRSQCPLTTITWVCILNSIQPIIIIPTLVA